MEPAILGSFFPGNKDDMNPVYFNHLGCMFVLHVGDTLSYHL